MEDRAGGTAGTSVSTIMHIDMDAFFVAVELLDRPELIGRPVIVGHRGDRSVVLSASYEARRSGVRSAMPMQLAVRRCPQAVVIEPTHGKYTYYSGLIMEMFRSVTPLVEQLSVDEAFLDVSGALRRLGPAVSIGESLRARLKSELGLTATVGIAASKFVAKIASTHAKPDGLLLIEPADTVPFLHTLPVGALWGVGAKTGEVLARLGIGTVADLAHTPVSTLKRTLGVTGEHIHRLAWGQDDRRVEPVRQEKSIGAEHTFAVDTAEEAPLAAELLRLCHRTAARLRAQNLQCGSVALKLRYADFSTLNRSRKLPEPADSAALIYAEALALLHKLGERPQPVRLIGVRAEQLVPAGGALQLTIDRRDGNWREVESALDRVNEKFGAAGLLPAALLKKPASGAGSANGPAPRDNSA